MFNLTPAAALLKNKGGGTLKDWVDFSLLPSFDKISRYFYITVYSGVANSESLSLKMFSPHPRS